MSFGEGNLHDEIDRLKEVNGSLCAEINRQEREIERLNAENAELKEECEAHVMATLNAIKRIGRLENIVRDMFSEWCATVDDYYAENIGGYYERMAELGIEVSE